MEEQYSLTYLDTTHPITMDRFRMILANPAAQTKGWVIVEGEADNIAYSRFLNGTDRMVMKAGYTAKDNTEHGGKKAVQNIVDNTLREDLTNNIIGIVDRDYRDFEQTQTELPAHVFCTDKRDLEMSLWDLQEVQNALIKYLSTDPQSKEWRLTQTKLDKTLEICTYMGTIHVSNVWHDIHCQYEFKNSHYWMHTQHQFLSDADWKKNLYDFYCAECRNLPQPISFTQSMLSDTILHFDLKVEKISDFGRGHDFLRILSNVMVQTSSYGEKALTQYMIDACTADIFSHTHLYSAIKSWQTDKHVSIVI